MREIRMEMYLLVVYWNIAILLLHMEMNYWINLDKTKIRLNLELFYG